MWIKADKIGDNSTLPSYVVTAYGCIRIKPQKYEILSLCLLKSSESANISHPGIQPASINRIHDTNELVHVKHLQLHNKYNLLGKLYIA